MKPLPMCPSCGAPLEPVEIVYGLPTEEAMEAARRGELVLGGCLVDDELPELACRRCQEPLPIT